MSRISSLLKSRRSVRGRFCLICDEQFGRDRESYRYQIEWGTGFWPICNRLMCEKLCRHINEMLTDKDFFLAEPLVDGTFRAYLMENLARWQSDI